MKSLSPIKRHPAIVSFSKDHHFGLLLVWKIRQGFDKAVNAERISNYLLYFFKEDLEKHFNEEEELLFQKLPVDDLLRKQAEEEHRAIYKLINLIRENKQDVELLNQFTCALDSHIRFEERELFNHLQTEIAPGDLETIAKRSSNKGSELDENWHDLFWK